ncbi:hypothetical protein [Archangium sp.]|uniref:hypothetical protein n=1 Tax=Archangium sp. TaxID=1872627 RepID=UPI0038997FF7
MTSTEKKKGRRLGSLQLGRQCKHASVELGPIHEARNVETGASALVMTPGTGSSWPKKNWQVRVSFQVMPPFLSVEVEQAPASGRLVELANVLVLVLAALDAVGSSARMRAHLTREPVGRWMRHPPVIALAAVTLVALVLGGGLWWGLGTRVASVSTPQQPVPVVSESADAGFSYSFLVDSAVRSPLGIAYPLPDKPASNQARPPCITERDEVAINGGCWVELARRPPCHKEQAEYQGKCYLPVSLRSPLPQSLSP